MFIVESEIQNNVKVPPTEDPNYQDRNPVSRVLDAWSKAELTADREHYDAGRLNFLFPFADLALYGPKPPADDVLDPRGQDEKQDFQKQNIADFKLRDCWLARGYAAAGNWDGCFLKLSYTGSPFSTLAQKAEQAGKNLGSQIRAWIKVGNNATGAPIPVPYNERTDRYELEIWAYPGQNLRSLLGERGQQAFDRGALIADTSLVRGDRSAFMGESFTSERNEANRFIQQTNNPTPVDMIARQTDHLMHPIHPVAVQVAWTTDDMQVWDSQDGRNYTYEFAMLFRGWNNYLQTGLSRHPHGGIGFLEYRNLMSNYFGLEAKRQSVLQERYEPELGRELNDWNFDANAWDGNRASGKPPSRGFERFMAVDYMDLHLLNPKCGIGIHRHRDNQEVFLLLEGSAIMLMGDWAQRENRERAFELRMMEPGDLTVCKTGQLHALYNPTDEQIKLFMFGGYD